jgi:hypothetical protein
MQLPASAGLSIAMSTSMVTSSICRRQLSARSISAFTRVISERVIDIAHSLCNAQFEFQNYRLISFGHFLDLPRSHLVHSPAEEHDSFSLKVPVGKMQDSPFPGL